jgi:hypothetical protein
MPSDKSASVKRPSFTNQPRATIAALFIAPVVPILISGATTIPGGRWDPIAVAGFAMISYLIVLALELSLGLSMFLILSRLRLAKWWSALVSGIVIGVAWAALIRLPGILQLRDFIVLGSEGGAAAITFWGIRSLGAQPTEPAPTQPRDHLP